MVPQYERGTWKYRLTEPFWHPMKLPLDEDVTSARYCLTPPWHPHRARGMRGTARPGPTVDSENAMRAALVHDVLYQSMRERSLAASRSVAVPTASFSASSAPTA